MYNRREISPFENLRIQKRLTPSPTNFDEELISSQYKRKLIDMDPELQILKHSLNPRHRIAESTSGDISLNMLERIESKKMDQILGKFEKILDAPLSEEQALDLYNSLPKEVLEKILKKDLDDSLDTLPQNYKKPAKSFIDSGKFQLPSDYIPVSPGYSANTRSATDLPLTGYNQYSIPSSSKVVSSKPTKRNSYLNSKIHLLSKESLSKKICKAISIERAEQFNAEFGNFEVSSTSSNIKSKDKSFKKKEKSPDYLKKSDADHLLECLDKFKSKGKYSEKYRNEETYASTNKKMQSTGYSISSRDKKSNYDKYIQPSGDYTRKKPEDEQKSEKKEKSKKLDIKLSMASKSKYMKKPINKLSEIAIKDKLSRTLSIRVKNRDIYSVKPKMNQDNSVKKLESEKQKTSVDISSESTAIAKINSLLSDKDKLESHRKVILKEGFKNTDFSNLIKENDSLIKEISDQLHALNMKLDDIRCKKSLQSSFISGADFREIDMEIEKPESTLAHASSLAPLPHIPPPLPHVAPPLPHVAPPLPHVAPPLPHIPPPLPSVPPPIQPLPPPGPATTPNYAHFMHQPPTAYQSGYYQPYDMNSGAYQNNSFINMQQFQLQQQQICYEKPSYNQPSGTLLPKYQNNNYNQSQGTKNNNKIAGINIEIPRLPVAQRINRQTISKSVNKAVEKPEQPESFLHFIEEGMHLCKLCNSYLDNVLQYALHLHSKEHISKAEKDLQPSDETKDNSELLEADGSSNLLSSISIAGLEIKSKKATYTLEVCLVKNGEDELDILEQEFIKQQDIKEKLDSWKNTHITNKLQTNSWKKPHITNISVDKSQTIKSIVQPYDNNKLNKNKNYHANLTNCNHSNSYNKQNYLLQFPPAPQQVVFSYRSSLLQLAQNNPLFDCPIKELKGYVLEFCHDEHGCAFLQNKIKMLTTEGKDLILDEIVYDLLSVMTNEWGTSVVQEILVYSTKNHKTAILDKIRGNAFMLAVHAYGSKTLESAYKRCSKKQQKIIVQELEDQIVHLSMHDHGSHVVQIMIEHGDSFASETIMNKVKNYLYRLSSSKYGCNVFKSLLNHCSSDHVDILISELHRDLDDILQDYPLILVELLAKGKHKLLPEIMTRLIKSVLHLATYSSGVSVLKACFEYGSSIEKADIIYEICGKDESESNLCTVANHIFGYKAVQYMVQSSSIEATPLLKDVWRNVHSLACDEYGFNVLVAIIQNENKEYLSELIQAIMKSTSIVQLTMNKKGIEVIESCLKLASVSDKKILIDEICGHTKKCAEVGIEERQVTFLSKHEVAFKIIQFIIQHLKPGEALPVIDEIWKDVDNLIRDPYGVFVIQAIAQHSNKEYINKLVRFCISTVIDLCLHHRASIVIENCLEFGNIADRKILTEEICSLNKDDENDLLKLLTDSCGMGVIRKIIELASDLQKYQLLCKIEPHFDTLKSNKKTTELVAFLRKMTKPTGTGNKKHKKNKLDETGSEPVAEVVEKKMKKRKYSKLTIYGHFIVKDLEEKLKIYKIDKESCNLDVTYISRPEATFASSFQDKALLESIVNTNPDILVLVLGFNDFHYKVDLQDLKDNYGYMIDYFKEKLPFTTLCTSQVQLRFTDDISYTFEDYRRLSNYFNKWINRTKMVDQILMIRGKTKLDNADMFEKDGWRLNLQGLKMFFTNVENVMISITS